MFSKTILTSVMADEPVPVVTDVESQPLKAQAQRIAKALQFLGSPLSDEETKKLRAATQLSGLEAVKGIQQVLDQRVLAPALLSRSHTGMSNVRESRTHAKWRLS
jgi:hypothetical protein